MAIIQTAKTDDATAPIGVGVVGASPTGSWGTLAHIPAVQALDGFRIAAICNARLDSALETAARYGIGLAFDSVDELAQRSEVDVVAVCVNVANHDELVGAALRAGKHVYCEWPLAVTSERAAALKSRAIDRGVVHAVGLQARMSPALVRARDLVSQGQLGRVLGCSITHRGPWPTRIAKAQTYLQDALSGGDFVAIRAGHVLDALFHVVGEPEFLSATVTTRFPEVELAESGERIARTSPDQLAIDGVLIDGALVSAHLQGVSEGGGGLRLEVVGSGGSLVVTGPAGPIQAADLNLYEQRGDSCTQIEVTENGSAAWPVGPPRNVARLYQALGEAIRGSSTAMPDFESALRRHETLDLIRRAAATGKRQSLGG